MWRFIVTEAFIGLQRCSIYEFLAMDQDGEPEPYDGDADMMDLELPLETPQLSCFVFSARLD